MTAIMKVRVAEIGSKEKVQHVSTARCDSFSSLRCQVSNAAAAECRQQFSLFIKTYSNAVLWERVFKIRVDVALQVQK